VRIIFFLRAVEIACVFVMHCTGAHGLSHFLGKLRGVRNAGEVFRIWFVKQSAPHSGKRRQRSRPWGEHVRCAHPIGFHMHVTGRARIARGALPRLRKQ
jgi:hypothetical protein